MLISLKANNCLIYSSEVEFSMRANMHYKHFYNNVYNAGRFCVVKSAILIGSNNSGKTCFVNSLRLIKSIILNQRGQAKIPKNLFTKSNETMLEVAFLENGHEYVFTIRYDSSISEYTYERFAEVFHDEHGNKREETLLLRDVAGDEYYCMDEQIITAMRIASRTNILIYLVNSSSFETMTRITHVLWSFASKIDIVDMNNIPVQKTIDMLKLNNEETRKIVNFILNADLSLKDYKYLGDEEAKRFFDIDENSGPQETVLKNQVLLSDVFHLASVYKGIIVPSMLFDSTGTKKIAALASYVIDALEKGRILVVDELDNSLHFRLTRAIIALFNNEMNAEAQLIATVHDISLLDCQTLFRKDQIWFATKDEDNAYLYPLSLFTAEKDKIRSNTDLVENYKRGVFGAIPEPDLFKSLLEVRENAAGSTE